MTIDDKKVVSLSFRLSLNNYDADIVEEASAEEPFTFLYGAGSMIPEFEAKLRGLGKGEAYKFMLTSDQAYGAYEDEMVVKLDKSIFVDSEGNLLKEELVEDNYIPMRDQEGNVMNGKVVRVSETKVTLDFNHPLADSDLYFSGQVLDVRDATEQEISHNHVHGAHGHHHHHGEGGCGCGSNGQANEGGCCSN